MRFHFVLAAALIAAACGSSTNMQADAGGGGTPDAGQNGRLTAIAVTPVDLRIIVENGVPRQQQYSAIGTYEDGTSRDVTNDVVWATFDPAVLFIGADGTASTSSEIAGSTVVKASKGDVSGQTTVVVIQRTLVIGAGAPADADDKFAAAALDGTVGRAPAIMYPSDNTVIPPNFNGLEFQFLRGQSNDLYELAIVSGYHEIRQYSSCLPAGSGCAITPDDAVWSVIAAKFAGKDTEVTVAGLQVASPTTKGISSPRILRFIAEPLDAGLYYWDATTGYNLMRFDFGHVGVPPEVFYTATGGNFCVGCHALSRDGAYAAVGQNSPSPSQLDLVEVASLNVLWSGGYGTASGSNYHAFSPDNSMLLTTDGYTLEVRDTLTGAVLPFGNVAEGALFPDWSADGGMIVYTRPQSSYCSGSPCSAFTTGDGSIYVRPFDGTAFGAAELLVPFVGTHNNYYPAFTPDSAWIVFNRVAQADAEWNLDSYDNRACKLWVIGPGGGNPVELANANGGYLGNTWPKVAPVIKPYADGGVTFITFTSRRPIGLRPASDISQVWMAAFDPARAAAGLDPSFAAVHLPWQNTSSGNHIAQWATEIPRDPCGPMGECPTGEFCENGECVPWVP